MIVVDASVAVDLLLQTPDADALSRRLFDHGDTIHAPQLLDIEVAQVLRRFAARGDLRPARGHAALHLFQMFPMTRHPHTPLLSRIWTLRENLTAYDAAYVALAEALEATLVTRDEKLRAAPGHRANVEVI